MSLIKNDRMARKLWCAREIGKHPQVDISFTPDGFLKVVHFPCAACATHEALCLDRSTARLAARRINQALDAWAKEKA